MRSSEAIGVECDRTMMTQPALIEHDSDFGIGAKT